MDPLGNGGNEFLEEDGGDAAGATFYQSGKSELGSLIHSDKEVSVTLGCAHFGEVDLEVAYGILFNFFLWLERDPSRSASD